VIGPRPLKMATPAVENTLNDPAPVPQETPSPALRKAVAREWLDSLQSLATTVVIAVFVITFLVQAFQIPSESMENTLLIGDYLLVDKFSFGNSGAWTSVLPYQKIRHGDIIVFKWPVHPEQHFVKRVIGVPGDRVHLVNGKVFVNGTPVSEDYAVHKLLNHDSFRDDFPSRRSTSPNVTSSWWAEIPLLTRQKDLMVPEGQYFVLGDNRDESLDSRYWGLVPRENIVGKPLIIYFSLRQIEDDPFALPADDKIERFAYRIWHLPAMARWDRMMQIVK
jgi:signal peptidase I